MVDEADVERNIVRLRHEHRERLKELSALHDIVRILRDPSVPVAELIARVAARLPASMTYSDDTTARVAYGAIESATPGFALTTWVLRRAFQTTDGTPGVIEIVYGTSHRHETEGPFLAEECALIDSIADILNAELDRRASDHAARVRETKLALAVATANLAEWEWSIDVDSVTWSPELVRIAGQDLTGEALGIAVHPDDRQRVIETVRGAVADPDHQSFDLQYRGLRADGEVRWISARGCVLRHADGRPDRVLAILGDTTQRKALEETAVKHQKLEAMAQVSAGVAHDVNNVLAVMTLSLGELVTILPDGDPSHAYANEIEDAVRHVAGLTRQLLAFCRRSTSSPVLLDPNAEIRRLEPLLKRLVGGQATLVLDLGSASEVLADATQFDQILMNLVANARDATTHGGTITIGTRVVEINATTVGATAKVTAGSYVVIRVSDTGAGMTPATKARLFEPFFTTKPSGKGTGLGLAVVFGVVQQSRGFVTVHSEPGRGARFDVHLPATTSRRS